MATVRQNSYFNPPTPWGWDAFSDGGEVMRQHFNPPTPWGWDDSLDPLTRRCVISIHPPRGGGTMTATLTDWRRPLFQSTHPVGVGRVISKTIIPIGTFQSTHPVGVGHTSPIVADTRIYFNPPTPWGWDSSHDTGDESSNISIHPPRGGGTA